MDEPWITNDGRIARALRRADTEYRAARERAHGLSLADKLEAFRAAKVARDATYKAILKGAKNA